MIKPKNKIWEKKWKKKKNDILGLFNAGQHHLLTQNGSVNLTASQQREEGESNCRDAKKAVDMTEEFFRQIITAEMSKKEKEIIILIIFDSNYETRRQSEDGKKDALSQRNKGTRSHFLNESVGAKES